MSVLEKDFYNSLCFSSTSGTAESLPWPQTMYKLFLLQIQTHVNDNISQIE